MQVYPNRFGASLQRGLQPFYMIFGDEPQQKLQAIADIRRYAKAQGFDERQSLVVDNQFSWNSLLEATQTLSLFSNRQYIELELPTGKPGTEGAKILTALSQQANPDILLVIHGAKIGKDVQSSKWFKSVDKIGVYVPCYPLDANQLQQWLAKEMKHQGLDPAVNTCQLLTEFCEGNLLAAKQEIEKLMLLYPDGKPTIKQVEQAVVDQSRFNVFQLVDVLLAGDGQKAVKMLYRLESEGVEPNIILWALVREWQVLQGLVLSQQQGKTINWHQLRIWKNRQALYLSAIGRLNLAHLNQLQQKLAIMDQALKQSMVPRPYVELCHLCLLFIPMPLEHFALQ
ncbi:MAG: DNA polymerase-3 subunit delta [Paraglaciecola sp.]|jgi:DNA polymerase-3 subunit delta